MLKAALIVVTALYPLGIYFGLQRLDPRWLSLLLFTVLALRLATLSQTLGSQLVWGGLILSLALITFIGNTDIGLLLYPVSVNVAFLLLFAFSCIHPPTVVESIARISNPNLPPAAVVYTRRVTQVWCAFFLLNGSLALYTVFLPHEVWLLYNGLIAYLLIGLLAGGELLYRRRFVQ